MANETIDKIIEDLRRVEHIITGFRERARVPDIERDIALGKLRNIYDFIQLLEVEKPAVSVEEMLEIDLATMVTEEKAKVQELVMEKKIEIPVPQTPEIPNPAPTQPHNPHELEIPVQQPAEIKVPKPDERPEPKPKENPLEQQVHVHSRKAETTTILAEKFQTDKSFLNEALAKYHNHHDISRKYQTTPIQDIFTAISLNEKYLYIKELFNNDPGMYKNTIEKLNAFNDFNQAVAFLDQQFKWDFNDFQVQKILELVHRRYLTASE